MTGNGISIAMKRAGHRSMPLQATGFTLPVGLLAVMRVRCRDVYLFAKALRWSHALFVVVAARAFIPRSFHLLQNLIGLVTSAFFSGVFGEIPAQPSDSVSSLHSSIRFVMARKQVCDSFLHQLRFHRHRNHFLDAAVADDEHLIRREIKKASRRPTPRLAVFAHQQQASN